MPELPEVETVVRGLRRAARHQVANVTYASPHLLKREPALRTLAGDHLDSFTRRGKYIIAELSSGRKLLIHLRMSGRLIVKGKRARIDKHDHLVLTFSDSAKKLVFRDVRKFGIVEFMRSTGDPRLDCLGPEANKISSRQLVQLIATSSRPIKALLLDQTKLAGLGNIYVDESLYRAGIHPSQAADSINRDDAAKLAQAIRDVLRLAIKYMGTTFDSYRRADGKTGQFAGRLQVYNKTGQSCGRCGDRISKIRLAGRGTHFCPTCQML
jgi:formamidopyrimidine-DNA glycosylase